MSVRVFFFFFSDMNSTVCKETAGGVYVRHPSTGVPAWVKVRDESSSHCDRSWVAQGKIVQAKH